MTKRLEQALHKLYTSFYDGTLNPECCYACAVGNICDNRDMWKHFTEAHGSLKLNLKIQDLKIHYIMGCVL